MLKLMPAVFVLLWSTGFIGSKYGLAYAESNTFLFYRFVISTAILLLLALVLRKRWPKDPKLVFHIAVTGILLHGCYLGGVFAAIEQGMPAGLVSILVGTQPIATALAGGFLLGAAVTRRQWLGLILGLAGVVLVLGEKALQATDSMFDGFGPEALLLAFIAMVGITANTLYQKKYCQQADLITGGFIQALTATVFFGAIACFTETMVVQWTPQFIGAMVWLVLALTIGAVMLLSLLIKKGEAHSVASLFYLVPPATALEGYFLFDEQLGVAAITGMMMAAYGVYLVVSQPAVKTA